MKDFPIRFRSLREKGGSPRRSKSVAREREVKQSRSFSADVFKQMFKSDPPKYTESDPEAGKEACSKEASKIGEVKKRLDKLNISNVSVDHIRDIMATHYADGDPERTAEFIDLEQKASAAVIVPFDPNVEMVGAENRSAVTCYIDALLFAMFCKLEAFEVMLKANFPLEDPRSKLVNLLRIWVNMLRTGKLIRTDLTKLLQEAIAECGWEDAAHLEQQDTSEAFAFITETLRLPLLALQVDLYHQGKADKDDHKVIKERLLNVAVPPAPDGKRVKLEDCLTDYFNAQVTVSRDSIVSKQTIHEDQASEAGNGEGSIRGSIRGSVKGSIMGSTKGSITSCATVASPVAFTPSTCSGASTTSKDDLSKSSQMFELNRSASLNDAIGIFHRDPENLPSSSNSPAPSTRGRSGSLIQRIVVDEKGRPSVSDDGASLRSSMKPGSKTIRTVTIPAWQFFRLIPWVSVGEREPQSNSEVATNFGQRPVVGICLKRYAMTPANQPVRLDTSVDIPESMRLPEFMLAANDLDADGRGLEFDANGLSTQYKLVLQSIVCHRGVSLQAGHYVAFARVAPKLLTDNRRHAFDPPPDYEEAQWVKFDDLEIEKRVTFVDNIKEVLKTEMPYLLFYQVIRMEKAAAGSGAAEAQPPSYDEFKISLDASKNDKSNSMPATPSQGRHSFIDDRLMAELNRLGDMKAPSIRLSAEVDCSPRRYGDVPKFGSHSEASISRRQSVDHPESTFSIVSPAITPDAQSLAAPPEDEPSTTASRLSRAASRFTFGSRSRPVSQSSEGRLGNAFRFMRPSKEVLRDPSTAGEKSAESSKSTSMELALEAKLQQEQALLTPKPKHKRAKSKEKGDKHKPGDQPDRECAVM